MDIFNAQNKFQGGSYNTTNHEYTFTGSSLTPRPSNVTTTFNLSGATSLPQDGKRYDVSNEFDPSMYGIYTGKVSSWATIAGDQPELQFNIDSLVTGTAQTVLLPNADGQRTLIRITNTNGTYDMKVSFTSLTASPYFINIDATNKLLGAGETAQFELSVQQDDTGHYQLVIQYMITYDALGNIVDSPVIEALSNMERVIANALSRHEVFETTL